MKIIEPSFEIAVTPDSTDRMNILKHIERIARTCYKSEDKITDDSCIKMINNLKSRKHWAMLEHYNFVFSVSYEIYKMISNIDLYDIRNVDLLQYLTFVRKTMSNVYPYYIVSLNATTINYIYNTNYFQRNRNNYAENGFLYIYNYLKNFIPELICATDDIDSSNTGDIKLLTNDDIRSLPLELREIHQFMSVKFICDRGVSHEIVRHRPASYAQESTRYCNYNGNKFGGELTVILPSFFKNLDDENIKYNYESWEKVCKEIEKTYQDLIDHGATPQEARSVLPNSVKTEIWMTANLVEWKHFLKLRTEAAAHPQMRELTIPLSEMLAAADPNIFGIYKNEKGKYNYV